MKKIIAFIFLVFALIDSAVSAAPGTIRLTIGEAKLIHVESGGKVAVGNPLIADVTAVSDQEILVSGKSSGSTNLLLVSAGGGKESRTIVVSTHNLKKSMVEVSLEIMEIESQSALKAGLSWGSISAGPATNASSLAANNLTVNENSPPTLLTFGTLTRQSLSASLQLLISRGRAKILAKPRLLAVSGEEAGFLSGGEIPYVVENKLGSPNVEWKPYGIKLKIRPTIDGEGNISASLRAEVSSLDTQNGVALGTSVVPAFRSRWAETTVYMRSGSTLVIAGLINEESQKLTSGIPLLSDIPLLGELFRFTENRQSQMELVIFVTPTLVGQKDEEG